MLHLERDSFEKTIFDWSTWRLAAKAGRLGLSLISAAVQQSAARWVGSHLWLLERSLPWINQVDYSHHLGLISAQQLAAQLTVALKPYAGRFVLSFHLFSKSKI